MYLINKKQEHLYRPNVGCVILKDDKIFVAKRIGYNTDTWQMPQGGVDFQETHLQALFRELLEEIGTNNVEVLKESSYSRYYKVSKEASYQAWKGKYIGQKQKWFLAKFNGKDNEINLQTKSPEFESWQWFTPEQTIKKAIFFKKDIYIDVLNEFGFI